jgi:hypothetical protein
LGDQKSERFENITYFAMDDDHLTNMDIRLALADDTFVSIYYRFYYLASEDTPQGPQFKKGHTDGIIASICSRVTRILISMVYHC